MQAVYVALNDLVSIVAMAGILFVGTGLVERRAIAIGVLVAVLLYVTQLFAPVQQLAQTFDSYQRARAGLRKINASLSEGRSDASTPTRILPTSLRGALELRHVTLSYRGSPNPALVDVSLAVPLDSGWRWSVRPVQANRRC